VSVVVTSQAGPLDDAQLLRGKFALGNFELILCSDGTFLLDGGAIFGVVPRTLWQKRMAPDADNRVRLGLNTLVVRTGSAVVVIETGLGNKLDPKLREFVKNQEQLPLSFKAAGISEVDITHVINTHLHFDHCGWNTTLHDDGAVTPTFPNARYFCAAGELAHGRLQLDRDRVSYLSLNYDPLIASGQLTLIDLDGAGKFAPDDPRLRGQEILPPVKIQTSAEIVPGLWVESLPGHTADVLGVHVESGGDHACCVSDLIPTHHHLDPTWVMGYDLDPLRCIEEKKKFLARAISERWLVVFPHDHQVAATRLEWNEKGKPQVQGIAKRK
jgi:glyoxylase-like metal-dependent hydrolase (beta-lactamase superfamily II)